MVQSATYHWKAAAESLNQQVFRLLMVYADCIYSSQTAAAEARPPLQVQGPSLHSIYPVTHLTLIVLVHILSHAEPDMLQNIRMPLPLENHLIYQTCSIMCNIKTFIAY